MTITKHNITGLQEGKEYIIRVKAVNKIGESEPSNVPEAVSPKDILGNIWLVLKRYNTLMYFLNYASEIPSFELDATLTKTVWVRAGNTIRLYCTVKGRPAPQVCWSKQGDELDMARTEIKTSDWDTLLLIPNCSRDDTGG